MYRIDSVDVIELTLPEESEEILETEPTEDYVKGTMTLRETAGTPGTEGPPVIDGLEIGIRLKGSMGGSFRPLKTGKAAFKIKCNFVSGKKCLGLKKMTLNNMVQDPSMVHEALAYSLFGEIGVPAPRSGYAYVLVNGEDFGLYANVEALDDVSLKRLFGSFDDASQHLYEGEKGHDVIPGEADAFEVDEGDDDVSNLEALAAVANGGGVAPWSTRLAPFADLAEMTSMWAIEKYIGHWDGYSGHAIAGLRPNNYYLLSEPSGRFLMLPSGMDQAWIPTAGVPGREVTFDGNGGVLFNLCLQDEECQRSYWEALMAVTRAMPAFAPAALATATAELLAPWEQAEREDGRPEFDAAEVEDGVEETLDLIADRPQEASDWLTANVPTPRPTPVAQPSAITPVAAPPLSQPAPLRLLGARRVAKTLRARVELSKTGTVSVRGTMKKKRGRVTACARRVVLDRTGSLTLRCKLSRAALRRLARHPLRLRLTIRLAADDGSTEKVVRRIRLARD